MSTKLLEKELSYKLQGIFYEVYNKYGNTYKEEIYQKACEEELKINKISFKSQPRIEIKSLTTGKKIGLYVPDLLIEDKIIIELKAQKFIPKILEKQLIGYLKASKYEVGYLVNFGGNKLDIRRRIYTNDRKPYNVWKLQNN